MRATVLVGRPPGRPHSSHSAISATGSALTAGSYDANAVRIAAMESGDTSAADRTPLDRVERLLAEHGHDLGIARVRVAADRRGMAVGFPSDPIIHVSWSALLALALVFLAGRRLRR